MSLSCACCGLSGVQTRRLDDDDPDAPRLCYGCWYAGCEPDDDLCLLTWEGGW